MFIILETFGGLENIVLVSDENGKIKSFGTKEEAEAFASEECQKPIIVDVGDAW